MEQIVAALWQTIEREPGCAVVGDGHADAKTTSIYLNVMTQRLQDSMKRFGVPLQPVATEAPIDHQPLCNEPDESDAQVVVN
ncbi:MAG TPA: hypothetical protein VN654_18570 [Vicinamibacterales bacterium]|jgi:hypothetical protein|nr:hypothetical protein [Vicinamibacterales bacterium]